MGTNFSLLKSNQMSANLEVRNGKTSFAAHGELAWHGTGQYFDKPMTAEQAIKESNMGFTVIKQEIQLVSKNKAGNIIIPNRFATVRTDTGQPLGIVGDRYEIIQNVDAFSFFDPIIDRNEALYETAGVLGNGERVFISAKLPADITVKGDQIKEYILLTTSHNGSTPLYAGFTPIRVVCNNTLSAALGKNGSKLSNKVVIRHTANAKSKIDEAARIMGLCSSYMEQVGKIFNQMAKVKITDEKLRNYLQTILVPNKEQLTKAEYDLNFSKRSANTLDEMVEFAKTHETQITDASKRTLFGAYNAVSGFYNFTKEYETADARMADVMTGGLNGKVTRAFELAVKMLN